MSDTMPASIVHAICTVKAGLEAVKKDSRNQHGNYNFASTDAIYAEVTRRQAAAGLVIITLEDEPVEIKLIEKTDKDGKTSTSQWLKCVYSFVLATAEATWSDRRLRRSLMIQITGPQTFMSAQSYAEKSFLRSLFQIPTGDMDLDSVVQADTIEDQSALNGNGKRKSSYAAKKDGTDKDFNEFKKAISLAPDSDALSQLMRDHAQLYSDLPARWRDLIDEDVSVRYDDLRSRELA